jgi:hypothetical protein
MVFVILLELEGLACGTLSVRLTSEQLRVVSIASRDDYKIVLDFW